MDTTALKHFATRARTELRKEVGGRIDVVLASNSMARVESAAAVQSLEGAISLEGREAVVERVAYTWFNRIIALRFMDANSYTPSAVVSPGVGKTTGQPEVLAEVKAGTFDHAIVPEPTRERIVALLSGTLHSVDPQGEAYGLLLEAYCRHWNKAMPFMFEREGDYTELLMPAALLAEDSVRDQAVRTLTEEACQEVEVIGWLYQFYISERKDEVVAGFKKNKKAGAAEIPAATQLFTPHWIVRYLVENSLGRLWLLNHPESKLAEQMDYYVKRVDDEADFLKIDRPEDLKVIDPAVGSGHMLTYAFDILYAIYAEQGYATSEIPGLILEHNLHGIEIDPRAGSLAAFALTMKAAARRKLFLKQPVQPHVIVLENVHFVQSDLDYLWSLSSGIPVARADFDAFWNAFEHADTFGSLIQPSMNLIPLLRPLAIELAESGSFLARPAARVIEQAEYLSTRYSIAVANPPYLSDKSLADSLGKLAAREYSFSKFNTYSMFMERAATLVATSGLAGLVVLHSWMSGAKYESLRNWLLVASPILTLAHIGSGGFDSISGEVVSTAAFVAHPGGNRTGSGVFIDITRPRGESAKDEALRRAIAGAPDSVVYNRASADFEDVPGRVVAYYASEGELAAFRKLGRLGDMVNFRQGMATTDNNRFLRQWSEVSLGRSGFGIASAEEAQVSRKRWFPYNKGGTPRAWYGNQDLLVDWADDGAAIKENIVRKYPYLKGKWGFVAKNPDYYFLPNVSYSALAGGSFAVRVSPPGFIFDTKGSCVFAPPTLPLARLAGLLNSSVVARFLELLAPTLDFNLASLKGIPVPSSLPAGIDEMAQQSVDTAKADWDDSESSWEFQSPSMIEGGGPLAERLDRWGDYWAAASEAQRVRHARINELVAEAYGMVGQVETEVKLSHVALQRNLAYTYGSRLPTSEYTTRRNSDATRELISYAVGCMFGRFSLDAPGLILADQGSTLRDYLAKVPAPSFMPDKDNVLPIVDGPWFEDDIVEKLRQFLRIAFGEEQFQENLKFVTDALGVKDLRDYFIKSGSRAATSKFYDDHVQRYKKRPIYWLFSSPSGAFNALVYLHRYNPSTVSTVLTDYLREYITKLEANLQHQELVAAGQGGATAKEIAAAQQDADRIRRVLVELKDYDHDVLFPLAGKQVALDLDEGVLVNYQKLGPALKDIGLKKGGGSE